MFSQLRKRPQTVAGKIAKGLLILVMVTLFVSLISLVAQLLWNAVIPQVFNLKPLEFIQAVALVILARIFIGFPGRHGGPPWARGRHWGDDDGGHHPFMNPGFGGREAWRQYGRFWKEEGRQAFEKFVERETEKNRQGGTSEEPSDRGRPGL